MEKNSLNDPRPLGASILPQLVLRNNPSIKPPFPNNDTTDMPVSNGFASYKLEPHLSDPSEIIDECKKIADGFKIEIEHKGVPDA